MWTRPALLLWVCVAAPAVAQATRTLDGVVQDSASGETLPLAAVSVPALGLTTRTNADGRFALLNVATGHHVLRIRYVGYAPRDLSFDTRTVALPLVVRLTRAPSHLEGIAVTAGEKQALDVTSGVEQISISTQQIATIPSVGEVDLFRALQLLPGISSTNDATSALYVRGGTPDQNLVLFDGMTVYQVDHFYGIFSAFNADAVKDIRVYPGAYPAIYGARVSSVVDVTGKSGDEHHVRGNAGLGLLSARGEAEIPLERGSILVAARRSYSDIVRSPLFNKLFSLASSGTSPGAAGQRFSAHPVNIQPAYYFYDFNAKGSYRPTGRDLWSISYYNGRDNLDRSSSVPAFNDQPSIDNTDVTRWGNHGASVRWFREWAPRLSSDLIASTSHYFSIGDRGVSGLDGAGGTREANTVDDQTIRLDNALQLTQRERVAGGIWLTRNRSVYDLTLAGGISTIGGGDIHLRTSALLGAGYLQSEWALSDALELTTGVRAAHYNLTSQWAAEPRASITYQRTPAWRLKAAWGLYHQFINRVENENVLTGSRDFWLLADSTQPVTRAEHRLLGVSYEPNAYLVNVEAYDKVLKGVTLVSRRTALSITGPAASQNDQFFHGGGREQGLEMLVQRKRGALTGWISYTVARAIYTIPKVNDGLSFPAAQDQTHEVKAVTSYARGSWTFSSTWVFGSGHPYTAPESEYSVTLLNGTTERYIHISGQDAERLPAYHRLDLAVFRRLRGASWFDWQIGASVFNVYNHRNVWYRTFDVTSHPIGMSDINNLGFTPSIDLSMSIR